MNYKELLDDHDHIDRLAERLEIMVEGSQAPAPDVDALLADLADVVAEHLGKEDSFIYPDIVRSADPADAGSLVVEFEALKTDWETYLATWRQGLATRNWPAFQSSTKGMLRRLRERIMKETALLYSVALREGLITMNPPGAMGREMTQRG